MTIKIRLTADFLISEISEISGNQWFRQLSNTPVPA
jgi:hypothetical protein